MAKRVEDALKSDDLISDTSIQFYVAQKKNTVILKTDTSDKELIKLMKEIAKSQKGAGKIKIEPLR